ncbi:hypothetical protein CBL_04343 [Carabus blaptoides fortunei]
MDQYTFLIYVLIGDDDNGEEDDNSPWLSNVYWIVCDWMNLVILLMTCSKTNDSANDIKKVLNIIKLCATDTILKQETMLFSLQLLNNDLYISACGFFNVDYELMFQVDDFGGNNVYDYSTSISVGCVKIREICN